MTRILIISRSFLLGGGMERCASTLGTKLYNIGYDVYYLTFSTVSDTYKVNGKHFSLSEKYYRLSEVKGVKNFLKNIKNVLKSLIFINPKIIKDFCYKYDIDLIISFGEYNNLPVLISRVLFKNRSKIIVSIHINPEKMYNITRNVHSLFTFFLFKLITIKLLSKKADSVVTVSRGIENSLYNYSFRKNRLKTIYNLINLNSNLKLSKEKVTPDALGIFRDSFVFINIGKFVPLKGQIHLIKSFKIVVKTYNKAKLVILGDGILKTALKDLVIRLNLEKSVFFLGIHSNIFPFLKNSDCFVFTSLWEGFGFVILEALSMNIPVISTDCKFGPREILCPELDLLENIKYPFYGKYGILTKPFNYKLKLNDLTLSDEEKMLADVMIKIIEQSDLRKKYSNGLIRAKDFDEKKLIIKWEKLINKIII